jgi:hypothetical protein
MKRLCMLVCVLALAIGAVIFRKHMRAGISPLVQKFKKERTVGERLDQFGNAARARLKPHFERAHVDYPPKQLTLVGLKEERVLQLYAVDATGTNRFIRSYPILAASGGLGPKVREGDRQVPEGILSYRVTQSQQPLPSRAQDRLPERFRP